jgi:hypothetical protein
MRSETECSWFCLDGAPRPMKMGTTRSRSRHDAAARRAPQSANLRRLAILHNASGAQDAVDVRVEEAAVAGLRHQDIAWLRCKFVDDGVVPAALGKEGTLQFGPGAHRLQRVRFMPVRRAGSACFQIVGIPAVLEVDDEDAGRTRSIEHLVRLSYRCRGARHVEAGKIAVAALRNVGVLHVDDDDGRFARPYGQWFRLRGQRDFRAALG